MSNKFLHWIVATVYEAAWLPLLIIFLLVFPLDAFGIFARLPDIDLPLHFIGGVATAYFCHRLSINASRFKIIRPYHAATHAVMVFGMVCAAAVVWEMGEFMSDLCFDTHTQLGNQDTMTDLLLSVLGGATFLAIAVTKHRDSRHSAP